ncbi:MAG TPA: hypothetical protein IAA66_04355 [Candidatus Avichristensenella intestinipullorum]|uniref:Uncharacterized protein n=1 Tax=Candidatus Avichristensenella intestinipullorum TaxID=2840693 RepID=A0A9D0YXR8_9FIRM|nr:hypothetical protein [Candidatus Avichristensenella intestinipullorum]
MDILFMETIGINIGFPLLSWKGMGRVSPEEKPKENQEKTKRKPKRIRPPRPRRPKAGRQKKGPPQNRDALPSVRAAQRDSHRHAGR